MGIKTAIGKLPLPAPLEQYLSTRTAQLGSQSLAIAASHAVQPSLLPLHHRDPFDRMLIAQTQLETMTLPSADPIFNQYDVPLIWAGRP